MSLGDIDYRMQSAFDFENEQVASFLDSFKPEIVKIMELIEKEQELLLLTQADSKHINRWETSIGIAPISTVLSERRVRLLDIIQTKHKTSTDSIAKMSTLYTGVRADVKVEASTIVIAFFGQIDNLSYRRFVGYITNVLPAHLSLLITLNDEQIASLYIYGHGATYYSKTLIGG